jgi:hypothetical protein
MGDNLIAFNNNRRYHQSETKRIWTRVLRDVALAISAAQYRFAYFKLKAVGFWDEVEPSPNVTEVRPLQDGKQRPAGIDR